MIIFIKKTDINIRKKTIRKDHYFNTGRHLTGDFQYF